MKGGPAHCYQYPWHWGSSRAAPSHAGIVGSGYAKCQTWLEIVAVVVFRFLLPAPDPCTSPTCPLLSGSWHWKEEPAYCRHCPWLSLGPCAAPPHGFQLEQGRSGCGLLPCLGHPWTAMVPKRDVTIALHAPWIHISNCPLVSRTKQRQTCICMLNLLQ